MSAHRPHQERAISWTLVTLWLVLAGLIAVLIWIAMAGEGVTARELVGGLAVQVLAIFTMRGLDDLYRYRRRVRERARDQVRREQAEQWRREHPKSPGPSPAARARVRTPVVRLGVADTQRLDRS